jgi:glutaconate CoA-transferase subunit A
VIVTAEKIVTTDAIRERPYDTVIPSFCVDAVCDVPFGSYPGNMPGEYFSDEDHLKVWMAVEADEAQYDAFLEKYVYGVSNFAEYLDLCGGESRISALRAQELNAGDA